MVGVLRRSSSRARGRAALSLTCEDLCLLQRGRVFFLSVLCVNVPRARSGNPLSPTSMLPHISRPRAASSSNVKNEIMKA